MIKNKHLFIRRLHRYLGVIIGIQFLGWTISGLYFSWTDIDEVHGDLMRKAPTFLSASVQTVSPTEVIQRLQATTRVDSVHSVRLISINQSPVYQVAYFKGHAGDGMHHHLHHALADAASGALRGPLTEPEAIAVALEHTANPATVESVEYLEATNGHHEYRDRPLPAWAIHFSDPSCTVYVSAEEGTFQNLRNDSWRIFDFLWMSHTMDFQTRDDINNWLLRAFSLFGLCTVLSGFALFIVSSKWARKK
jgi:hypothetical protein